MKQPRHEPQRVIKKDWEEVQKQEDPKPPSLVLRVFTLLGSASRTRTCNPAVTAFSRAFTPVRTISSS